MVGVHATRRTEVGELKIAPSILNALPKHVQHPTPPNLSAHTVDEFNGRIRSILAFQSLILFQLCQLNKPQGLTGYQTEGFTIMGRL